MKNYLKGFIMALGMFTTIPIGSHEWDDNGAKHMLVFYPVIGAVIGCLWYIFFRVISIFNLPIMILSFFMMAFPYIITGLLHLDGFMDVHDAILSRRDREERLRILKDSYTGAFAVISVVFLLIFNFVNMNSALLNNKINLLLVFVPMLSRAFIVLYMVFAKTLKQSASMAYFKKYIGKTDKRILIILALITLLIYFYILGFKGLICALSMILIMSLCVSKVIKNLGGMSGDIAGYGLVICETIGIFMLAIM